MFLSFNAQSAVWIDTESWSVEYEQKYSEWMSSSRVREVMFTDINSPYRGINPDCADAAYALRAVFAYEHKLPFAITYPSGSRAGKTMNNRMNNWDQGGNTSELRLVAMVKEIGSSVGTESLAYFDTFPTAIKTIQPGTLFMFKIKARWRKYIRHSMNIKNINPVGTFDVIYSTQANQNAKQPLIRKKQKEFEQLPHSPWGFKKFRWPQHLGADINKIPAELGPSMEQFVLAERLGQKEFFKYVKKTVATENETRGQKLNRAFAMVCDETVARIDYVNQALVWLAQHNNRCMNYAEYDAYSTPSRDSDLKELYVKLLEVYKDAENAGELDTAKPEIVAFTRFIFTGNGSTNIELQEYCPVKYRPEVTTDLATIYKRISKGTFSSHPNDKVEIRWGEATSPKTKCKKWY